MRRIKLSPDDPLLELKRLMHSQQLDALKLSMLADVPYHDLLRSLNNTRDFRASEIKAVARAMRIDDIPRLFNLRG